MAVDHFSPEVCPDGYAEWWVGDETNLALTSYQQGNEIDLDSWELKALAAMTHPKSEVIMRLTYWETEDQDVLTFYAPEDVDPWEPGKQIVPRRRFFNW